MVYMLMLVVLSAMRASAASRVRSVASHPSHQGLHRRTLPGPGPAPGDASCQVEGSTIPCTDRLAITVHDSAPGHRYLFGPAIELPPLAVMPILCGLSGFKRSQNSSVWSRCRQCCPRRCDCYGQITAPATPARCCPQPSNRHHANQSRRHNWAWRNPNWGH